MKTTVWQLQLQRTNQAPFLNWGDPDEDKDEAVAHLKRSRKAAPDYKFRLVRVETQITETVEDV